MYIYKVLAPSDFRLGSFTYQEVDAGTSSQNVGARNYSFSAGEPLRRARLIEGCRFRVQLQVPGVDPWPEDPWVVEVSLSGLDQKDFKIMIQICQTIRNEYIGKALADIS